MQRSYWTDTELWVYCVPCLEHKAQRGLVSAWRHTPAIGTEDSKLVGTLKNANTTSKNRFSVLFQLRIFAFAMCQLTAIQQFSCEKDNMLPLDLSAFTARLDKDVKQKQTLQLASLASSHAFGPVVQGLLTFCYSGQHKVMNTQRALDRSSCLMSVRNLHHRFPSTLTISLAPAFPKDMQGY